MSDSLRDQLIDKAEEALSEHWLSLPTNDSQPGYSYARSVVDELLPLIEARIKVEYEVGYRDGGDNRSESWETAFAESKLGVPQQVLDAGAYTIVDWVEAEGARRAVEARRQVAARLSQLRPAQPSAHGQGFNDGLAHAAAVAAALARDLEAGSQ